MPGDQIPKFIALPSPCKPPRAEEVAVRVHRLPPPKLPRVPVPLFQYRLTVLIFFSFLFFFLVITFQEIKRYEEEEEEEEQSVCLIVTSDQIRSIYIHFTANYKKIKFKRKRKKNSKDCEKAISVNGRVAEAFKLLCFWRCLSPSNFNPFWDI